MVHRLLHSPNLLLTHDDSSVLVSKRVVPWTANVAIGQRFFVLRIRATRRSGDVESVMVNQINKAQTKQRESKPFCSCHRKSCRAARRFTKRVAIRSQRRVDKLTCQLENEHVPMSAGVLRMLTWLRNLPPEWQGVLQDMNLRRGIRSSDE